MDFAQSFADETHSSVSVVNRQRSTFPDFIDEANAVPIGIQDEIIQILVAENIEYVTNLPEGSGSFLETDIVQYLFTICVRLRIPDDVKYVALDILDRYMNIQGLGLWDAVAVVNGNNRTKFKLWEKTETTLSRQLTLRICTSIQIASKAHSFDESLAKNDVLKCLQALGFPYTSEAIHKSELRMLDALDFNIHCRRSPAVYMMNFLKRLILERPELVSVISDVYRYCLFWIDYAILNRNLVYRRILSIVHGDNHVRITRDKLSRVQADYSLLGCAAIIASLVSIQGPNVGETYIPPLSIVTRIAESDISDASSGLLRTLIRDKSLF